MAGASAARCVRDIPRRSFARVIDPLPPGERAAHCVLDHKLICFYRAVTVFVAPERRASVARVIGGAIVAVRISAEVIYRVGDILSALKTVLIGLVDKLSHYAALIGAEEIAVPAPAAEKQHGGPVCVMRVAALALLVALVHSDGQIIEFFLLYRPADKGICAFEQL